MFNTLASRKRLAGAGGGRLAKEAPSSTRALWARARSAMKMEGLGPTCMVTIGAQPVCEIPEKGFDVWGEGNAEPVEVADKWKRRRAGRKAFLLGWIKQGGVDYGGEEKTQEKKDEVHRFHVPLPFLLQFPEAK
ncbi:hypothetical protein HPP92_008711 [Vanilla planifolia]|uniref:Uncharacterized protein n=1 Tax=Vanilla planifolia TaxID=51239 RepID=A0A835RCG6_VANPL|nr:hypothetical protein HPP92_008711 [Vanilla planifolia]